MTTLTLAGCSQHVDAPASSADPSRSAQPSPDPSSRAATPTHSTDTVQPAGLPSQNRWLSDVHASMRGWQAYLASRAGRTSGKRLAVNLDIDNTALASQYHWGAPVPDVLAFARSARSRGVAVLFNTARDSSGDAKQVAERQLAAAGYPVTEVCLRAPGEDVAVGKQRCRRHFRDEGYTLIANVGNNDTDFEGGGYQRAFRLPNYGRLS